MITRGLRGLSACTSVGVLIFGALCLSTLASLEAASYYLLPTAAGTGNGSSWANALGKTSLSATINTTMVAGDTLFLGSGAYGTSTIPLASSGTSVSRKTITGVDTGSGLPVFESNNWVRTNPDAGQSSIINGSGSYWTIENLNLRECQYAVRLSTANNGLTFRNLLIERVRHGFYVSNQDNMVIENCSVLGYSKHGFRLDLGCDNVTFTNCVADLSNGDVTWWDYSEAYPFGFIVNNSGAANTNVAFVNCTARNNRWNNNGSVTTYWNGDGFVAESNTVGLSLTGCVSTNNEDGGFDIKPAATFTDCVSVHNYRGFRLWDTAKTLTNCVATYPFRRSNTNPAGLPGGSGLWIQNGAATVDFFTYNGNGGTGAVEEGSGSITLTNSIIAQENATSAFTSGSVTLGAGTVTYRPGTGVNPNFVNPSDTWDGIDNDMDSQTYGSTKGYNSGALSVGDVISVNLTDPANLLAATDVVGAIPMPNWVNSSADNQTISNMANDSGAATTADVSFSNTIYYYTNNTSVLAAPLTDDAKMMRSQRGTTTSGLSTGTVTQVPYASYDVYVYWGGRCPQEAVPFTAGIEFQQLSGGVYTTTATKYIKDDDRLWDGTYNESTATVAADAVDGNEYVVFRNVTTPEFRIRATGGVRLGICGFQIVEH